MAVYAVELETTPARLQGAVARLKKDGNVRTTGARQFKRYFPAVRKRVDAA